MMKRNVRSQTGVPVETPPHVAQRKAPLVHKDLKNTYAVRVWLVTYNLVNTLGWLYVFTWIFYHWIFEGLESLKYSFEDTKMLVSFLLSIVILDLVHEALGWVGNADISVFVRAHCKVLRRSHMYFMALWFVPETQRHVTTGIMLFLWAMLDLIRYPFYALNTFRISPYGLTYARYSSFIILYPAGFVSEIWVWFLMMPYIAERELHSVSFVTAIFPALRFWYFYAVILYIAYRFITFPINYRRMLRDRNRKLFGEPIEVKPQEKTDQLQRDVYQAKQQGEPLSKLPAHLHESELETSKAKN
jgi:very-long-chain (3R)-3-hydroxyacyl-CoA dehydratase